MLSAPGLFAQSASVKLDQTSLNDACGEDGRLIARLPAGTPVTIRFVLSGEAVPCYKISATAGGTQLTGYVAASALQGLDSFEKGLRDAPRVGVDQVMNAVRPSALSSSTGSSLADSTLSLLDAGQPEKALELIEPAARGSHDPGLLAIAGAVAWRSDDAAKALDYWRASLAIRPNPELESLYQRVEREQSNDRSTTRLYGIRVTLRYEPGAVPVETARAMLDELDRSFGRVSAELGCSVKERIVAIAQSPEAYRKTTDAAEWSGGQYEAGRIRVPVPQGSVIDGGLRRTLAHEITHACLSLTGTWPAWLQEGLAQRMSGDAVSEAQHREISQWIEQKKIPRLEDLGQDWSRLDSSHASAAYTLSLQAVDLFCSGYGMEGVRNLLHNPGQLAGIEADLDRRLGL